MYLKPAYSCSGPQVRNNIHDFYKDIARITSFPLVEIEMEPTRAKKNDSLSRRALVRVDTTNIDGVYTWIGGL